MHKDKVKLLQSLEETREYNFSLCRNCIYRNKELSHCWYTMTTNKLNKIDNECKHFVDAEKAIEILNKN